MKHLKLFKTEAEYTQFKDSEDYILPNVSYVVENAGVAFNPHTAAANLIEFTVEGTPYQAEEGMTWGEFVESEYNNGDFETAEWEIDEPIKFIYHKGRQLKIEGGDDIEPLTNKINSNGVYYYSALG